MKKKEVKVFITGDVSVMNIEPVYNDIKKAFEKADIINIIGNEIENIDLSVIQLLISAKLQAESDKKELKLNLSLPKDVAELITRTGLNTYIRLH